VSTNRRNLRRSGLSLAAAVLAAGAALYAATPASADQSTKHDVRFGGSDRYATAAQLFGQFGNRSIAVVVSGENFPDALSSSFVGLNASAALGKGADPSGVLLTRKNTLPDVTKTALIKSGVARVIILGGTGSVSKNVANAIGSIKVSNYPLNGPIKVTRYGGADRYETNLKANNGAVDTSSPESQRSTVLMASGENFPDALATGPIAWRKNYPLILTNGKTLGSDQTKQLDIFKPSRVVIVGGTSAVSSSVESAIKNRGISVTRVAGTNRQDTAARVASWATTTLGFGSVAGISTGLGFSDALAAGPVLGLKNATLLLSSNADKLGSATADYLRSKPASSSGITELIAIGGPSVVSDDLMAVAANAVGG
jgi:putative cell wall-binding protein